MPVIPRFKRRALPVLMGAATLALSLSACASPPYPHAQEPIGDVQAIYDGKLSPELAVTTFRNTDRLFPVRTIKSWRSSIPAAAQRPTPRPRGL